MSRQQARDLAFGRRGGGWSDANGTIIDDAPRCEVCREPMVAGQRRRHGVCSPRLECCGAYEDLLGPDVTVAKHLADHRTVEADARTPRGRK